MTSKEVAEIRRRFSVKNSNITKIVGCYISATKEIVAKFNEAVATMPEDELEKFLGIFKKTLGGKPGVNFHDICMSTKHVQENEAYATIQKVWNSKIQDDIALDALYTSIAESLPTDSGAGYTVLLAVNVYDVPTRQKDGLSTGDSETSFTYLTCAICPVKQSKPALMYNHSEEMVTNTVPDWCVTPPTFGFMFPAFDNRATNLYSATYFEKTPGASISPQMLKGIWGVESIPITAADQKEIFTDILQQVICDRDDGMVVVQNVNQKLLTMMESAKEENIEDSSLNKENLMAVLQDVGLEEEELNSFEELYSSRVGEDTEFQAENITAAKALRVDTENITMKVNALSNNIIRTKVIDGIKYLLVPADDNIQINGVDLSI